MHDNKLNHLHEEGFINPYPKNPCKIHAKIINIQKMRTDVGYSLQKLSFKYLILKANKQEISFQKRCKKSAAITNKDISFIAYLI